MARVKPFRGLRPPKELAPKVACLPYDVMNTEEARKMAEGNPYSLLHITRAEIDLPPGTDEHSPEVYEKSRENFRKFIENGWLIQDQEPHFYIYAQTMDGRTQYGIVGGAHYMDYYEGKIKKHELTRPEKERDRTVHILTNNAQLEPVFLAFRDVPELTQLMMDWVNSHEPEYDFVAEDGIGHHFWVIDDPEVNKKIEELFATKVPHTYIADGHHRTAAAALVAKEKAEQNPNHTGEEEYCYIMAVHFPHNQLKIMDYNRVIKDLNGHTPEEIIQLLKKDFEVQEWNGQYKPEKRHTFGMYLDGKWYKLTAKPHTYNDDDPIDGLDVTVLTKYVLEPIFDIKDLRRSKRIDFVGGIRGLGELERRVNSGEMAVAFALYPVSMEELMRIADTGNIMPPKTTWFEPKLRSGLVIHKLD
jgi:uncharacterized protein (DUF1015 family)